MNIFETSATVEDQGRVQVVGVPFAKGTQVSIAISPKLPAVDKVTHSADAALEVARERMRELFRTTKGFRNSPRIPREELYERGRLR